MRFKIVLIAVFLYMIIGGCSERAIEEKGDLAFVASGESLIKDGFTSCDGFKLSFTHVYVSVDKVKAYMTSKPDSIKNGAKFEYSEMVDFKGKKTVDLLALDYNEKASLVGLNREVKTGIYNAVSWDIVKSDDEKMKGNSIVLIGKASKNGITTPFEIRFDVENSVYAGEYIGDERKGIVLKNKQSDLEMTYHFDHLFGISKGDDSVNKDAFGFEKFMDLKDGSKIDIELKDIKGKISEEDYSRLIRNVYSLAHVGEGHCYSFNY